MQYITTSISFVKFWISVAALSLLALLVFASQAIANNGTINADAHMVSIYDRGVEQTIITKASTVRGALEQANIDVAEVDIVEPQLDEKLIDTQYNVNIYRARPVTVKDGNSEVKTLTAAQTATGIAKSAKVTIYPEDETKLTRVDGILGNGGAGLQLAIDRATVFTLVQYGKQLPQTRSQAATVGAMLKDKGIVLGAKDGVSVPLTTPLTAGMTVSVWRNGEQTVTQEEEIPMPVEQVKDQDREPGYKAIKTVGKAGKKTVTYKINMQNGKEIGREKIAEVETAPAVKQVEVVGAKFSYTGGPLSEAQINALGMCETHMNPTTNTGNGFYGAFQFMASTWRTVAPAPYNTMMPHEAPLEAQKQAVQTLLSRSSIYTQFPGCAKKMTSQGIL